MIVYYFTSLRYLITRSMPSLLSFLVIFLSISAPSAADESEVPASSAFRIPALPASGIVAGRQFAVEDAKIDGNKLVLRQGPDFFADVLISIHFREIKKGADPAGMTISYSGPNRVESPEVFLQWRVNNEGLPEDHWVRGDYTVHVEFGQEKKQGWLPGRIYLKVSEDPGAQVAGEFNAVIKGLRLINGVPDIRSDSFETLEYVALEYLEQRFPDAPVKINDTNDVILGYKPRDPYRKDFTYYYEDQQMLGRMALRYSVNGKDRGWTKLKFRKKADGWAVDYQLEPYRLFAAHDDPDTDDIMIIQYLVARHIEGELTSGNSPDLVHGVSMNPSYGRFFGEVRIRYLIGFPGREIKRRFLLVPLEDSWKIKRELEPDEVVDNVNGKILRTK